MGSGFAIAVGFFYLWPLMILITVAVYVCIAYTKPENHNGALTNGGKRMIWSRAFLGVGCAIYYICVAIGVALDSGDGTEPMLVLGFWDNHLHAFLALIVAADVSMLVAMVYAFRGRGSRGWIIQIATVVVVISSTFVTFLFLLPS